MTATVEITTHALNVRVGPGTSYPVTHALAQGQQASTDMDNFLYGAWLHITSPWEGYVSTGSTSSPYVRLLNITITPAPQSDGQHVKATTYLNVRSGPGTGYKVLFVLSPGQIVAVEGLVSGWYKLAGVNQYISAAYSVPVTATVPVPTPGPSPVPPPSNLSWSLPFSASQRGVGTNTGGWVPGPSELALIRANDVQVAYVMGYNTGVAAQAVAKLREAGIQQFIIRASTYEPITTAQRFLDLTMPVLREYYVTLGSPQNMMIAIHNEPNLISEGLGKGWSDGAGFAAFWATVAQVYRNAFPSCKLGFPAMSPGTYVVGVRENEIQFVQEAAAAVRAADWIGVHAYWQNQDGSDFAPPINAWRQIFGSQPIVATEVGPVGNATVTPYTVLNAYKRLADAGIPTMAWVLNGTGQFQNADWTFHNLRLNPNSADPVTSSPSQPTTTVASKLGIHVETTGGVSADILNTATRLHNAGKPWALVVVIDDVGLANALAPVVRNVIYRNVAAGDTFRIGNLTSEAAAQAEAEKVWATHAPFIGQLDKRIWIQTRNETGSATFDYAYECRIMDLAKAQQRHVVICGDYPGSPEITEFQWRIPALRQAMRDGHALSLHEYSAFVNNQPSDTPLCDPNTRGFYGLRHRMLYASVPPECRPKLFNSETGLSTVHMDSIADIEGYCSLLNEDDYVQGMAIYGMGASRYNLNGQLAALEQLRMRQP